MGFIAGEPDGFSSNDYAEVWAVEILRFAQNDNREAIGLGGRSGRSGRRRLHCLYSTCFESNTRKIARGMNGDASLLHRG